MNFEDLGLSAELLRAIADQGYNVPTPVQAQAIPVVLQGRDILAGAQTGTGKTAAFTLPLLHRLGSFTAGVKGARAPVRALILTPTRELAAQVLESVRTYGKHVRLKSAAVFGGTSMHAQIKALRAGVDVLVATPGRLLDHVTQKTVDLSQIEILVMDEADRMLDMGFIRDIRKILALMPKNRQNMLFSATFSGEIKQLADGLLTNPALIEVERRGGPVADLVTQVAHPVDRERKRDLLLHLIETQNLQQVLVFTRTKHSASRLSEQLEKKGIKTAAIHGNKTQAQRMKALRSFKEGNVTVLVATDIAARGLDIDHLPHVVNFELPFVPEDYVHRIGRTGRAGAHGDAISLVCVDEQKLLGGIQRLLKKPIPNVVIAGFEPTPGIRAEALFAGRSAKPARSDSNGKNGFSGKRTNSSNSRPARPGNGFSDRGARKPGAAARPAREEFSGKRPEFRTPRTRDDAFTRQQRPDPRPARFPSTHGHGNVVAVNLPQNKRDGAKPGRPRMSDTHGGNRGPAQRWTPPAKPKYGEEVPAMLRVRAKKAS